LPRVAEQRPHRAQGGAVARLDAEPVEGCHPEGASQILAPQLGVEFPRLALGAHGARKREGSRRAAGKHEFPGFVASEHRGEVLFRRPAIVPRREGETQFASGELRVVLEHLVEVTHPEEQDGVGVSCLDLAILLHQRGVRLDARRHGSSTTNGWPPSRVLRRRWACAASSCDAYRPTRTLNKPLVSRTTRASKPITFRRVSISSTFAALFTANTWTAYVA